MAPFLTNSGGRGFRDFPFMRIPSMSTNTATLSPETRNALATRARELLCTVEEEEVFAFLNKEVKGRTVPHPDMPEVLCTVEFAQWDSEGWCIELFVEFGNSEATAVCLAV